MQTHFTSQQLKDPELKEVENILRSCVHCGMCTATCPTYVLLGDELDSPRGRIYLMQNMLEQQSKPSAKIVSHIDKCLSCLACTTTCPSGVDYAHLVDHARNYIEQNYARPWHEKLLRLVLTQILPYKARFRMALRGASLIKSLAPLFEKWGTLGKRISAMLALAPSSIPQKGFENPATFCPTSKESIQPKKRVILLTGCAQPVLSPSINKATIELLTRCGVEIILPEGEGCCGALVHHMGKEKAALKAARSNIDAWMQVKEEGGLDAIIMTASGCGTTVKDYGHMLRFDKAYKEKAAFCASLTKDITEFLDTLEMPEPINTKPLKVAYHSACSMQHGQKLTDLPMQLLRKAGFETLSIPEGHLCCGSAGVYNIMQPDIATQLKSRKLNNIAKVKPDIIATGNIGCITQLSSDADAPILHTIELLNWAYGGEKPEIL